MAHHTVRWLPVVHVVNHVMREGRVHQKEARVENFYDSFDYDVRCMCSWWWYCGDSVDICGVVINVYFFFVYDCTLYVCSTQGDGQVDFAEFQKGFKKLKERDPALASAPKAEHPSLALNSPASGSWLPIIAPVNPPSSQTQSVLYHFGVVKLTGDEIRKRTQQWLLGLGVQKRHSMIVYFYFFFKFGNVTFFGCVSRLDKIDFICWRTGNATPRGYWLCLVFMWSASPWAELHTLTHIVHFWKIWQTASPHNTSTYRWVEAEKNSDTTPNVLAHSDDHGISTTSIAFQPTWLPALGVAEVLGVSALLGVLGWADTAGVGVLEATAAALVTTGVFGCSDGLSFLADAAATGAAISCSTSLRLGVGAAAGVGVALVVDCGW
jgi:hypothetical protein